MGKVYLIAIFIVATNFTYDHLNSSKQILNLTTTQDPAVKQVMDNLAWQWVQQYEGSGLFTKIVTITDPGTRLTLYEFVTDVASGPVAPSEPKNPPPDHIDFTADLNYYVLDALRAYIFAPGSNPFDIIWHRQNDGVRAIYGNYVQANSEAAFWKLVISSAMADHPLNLDKCREGLMKEKIRFKAAVNFAKLRFAEGNDIFGMFSLMYGCAGSGGDEDYEQWYRAAYRDNRAGFIALVKSI